MLLRCSRLVHWIDTDTVSTCILEISHLDWHTDGLLWFDDDGLRRPTDRDIPYHRQPGLRDWYPHSSLRGSLHAR